jgi:hypothetical protein
MGVGLDELRAAVDALSAVDADALDDAELDDLVAGVFHQEARLAAVKARLVRRWEAVAGWAADGSRTAATALARDSMTSSKRAGAELHRARALASMPATAAALAEGRFSTEYVDLLVRANQPWRRAVFAEHEVTLVEQIAGLRYQPARRLIEYWIQRADADGADVGAARHRDHAHVHASTTLDGQVAIDGVLDPIRGAIVTNELKRLEREIYLADKKAGISRSTSQRNADALVEMARRSTASTGTPARPLFTVLVGDESLTRLCELGNGTVIAPGALLPWMCTAMLESVIFDGPSTVISVSHKRTFTGAIRRAIQVRDRHCQHTSGCDVAAQDADVDHITASAHGGPTTQFNGRIICPPHNRDRTKQRCATRTFPIRRVTRLDELGARTRWQRHHHRNDDDDDEHDDSASTMVD